MQRRILIGAAGFWATWRCAVAQPARKLHRIGVVVSQFKAADITGPQTQSPAVNALLAGLRELGYVYGEQFRHRAPSRARASPNASPHWPTSWWRHRST